MRQLVNALERRQTNVLAHGCFDVLHLGHIRHLQEAKSLGSTLTVSVTSDRHVNKGIGRPYFTAEQRAEALRSLDCVDSVIINDDPDPSDLIRRIRPDVYVKGIDYKGGLTAEENEAVAQVGGRIHITEAEKFSSSSIIKAEKFSPEVCRYLEDAKAQGFYDKIIRAFDVADTLRIAFVGETIIDEYRYVQGLGRASKELMLATVETGSEVFDGGVLAAAKHGDWQNVKVVTSCDTIKKTRFVDADFNRKLFDVYSARRLELSDSRRTLFNSEVFDLIRSVDVAIVLDFGHGLIDDHDRHALSHCQFLAVNAQTNAGNYGFNPVTKYLSPHYICVDDPEARLATGMQTEPMDLVASAIENRTHCNRFLITHGRNGSYHYENGIGSVAPAFVSGGVDTMGAGDAVMAVTSPLVAAGLGIAEAAFVGNVVGAIKVSILGHRRPVSRNEVLQTVKALLA